MFCGGFLNINTRYGFCIEHNYAIDTNLKEEGKLIRHLPWKIFPFSSSTSIFPHKNKFVQCNAPVMHKIEMNEYKWCRQFPTPISSIPTLSTSHFVNSHFVNIGQMGIDNVGIDAVEVELNVRHDKVHAKFLK